MPEVVVAGAAGRMGSRIIACLRDIPPDARADAPGLILRGALEAAGHPALGRDAGEAAGVGSTGVTITADPEAVITRDRILVEFSSPEATLEHLRLVAERSARAVIGTTGFSPAQRDEIAGLGARAPIMVAPNMSVGVTVALRLLAEMARALGDDYDVEISEVHHRFKKDAPSGTAKTLAERIESATGRKPNVHAVRSGDVVGEHRIVFGTLGDSIEIIHRASTRDIFAKGSIEAAKWAAKAKPGLYTMLDVIE